MKRTFVTTLSLLFYMSLFTSTAQPRPQGVAHSEVPFDLTLQGPLDAVAPLFGADKERKWAGGDWDPHFLYPTPSADQKGAVFSIKHGKHTATWICTAFDLSAGHVQYVYILPEIMVTLIDINLNRRDENSTSVHVVYERTALSVEGNEHVNQFAESDRKAAPIWEHAINEFLKNH